MADIHEKINRRGLVEAWANYTLQKWKDALRKKGIGKTRALERSFKQQLYNHGNDVKAVELSFLFRGRFRDMGVGRGLKAYATRSNASNRSAARSVSARVDFENRTAKRWYNKIKTAQTYRLGELLADQLGEAWKATFEENASTITVKL